MAVSKRHTNPKLAFPWQRWNCKFFYKKKNESKLTTVSVSRKRSPRNHTCNNLMLYVIFGVFLEFQIWYHGSPCLWKSTHDRMLNLRHLLINRTHRFYSSMKDFHAVPMDKIGLQQLLASCWIRYAYSGQYDLKIPWKLSKPRERDICEW